MLTSLLQILLLVAVVSGLLTACAIYGGPFIAGVLTGYALFEFGYWGENGRFYWFSGRRRS